MQNYYTQWKTVQIPSVSYISTEIYSVLTHQIKIASLWPEAISLVVRFFLTGEKYCMTNQKPSTIFSFGAAMRSNRPFLSSLVPLLQSESKCETILMKMTLNCMKMKLHAELIFIWKVSHLDSFWNRGTRELGNDLLRVNVCLCELTFSETLQLSNVSLNFFEWAFNLFSWNKLF